jgi:ATP-binding cassette subfamily B protein
VNAPTGSERKDDSGRLVRRLIKYAWRYKGDCILILALQLILLALGIAGLGLVGAGLDVIAHAVAPEATLEPKFPFGLKPNPEWSPLEVIIATSLGIVVLALIRAALTYYYQIKNAVLLQQKIVPDLRDQVFRKLQVLGARFQTEHDSGSLFNRVTGDVQNTRMFVDGVILQTIILGLSLVTYLVYMFQIHVLLTLACLATTPVLWILTRNFSKKIRPAYMENRRLMDGLVLRFSENVRGIQTVKAFASESRQIEHFEKINSEVRSQQGFIFRTVSTFTPTIHFLTHFNLVVLLGYGGWLYIQGQISLGSGLLVLAGLLQQFSGQIANIAGITNSIQQSLTSARRVFEVLDREPDIAPPKDPVIREGRLRGAIRFENVCFRYSKDGPWVLNNVSFEVPAGAVVGIFGKTGSGKTTLLSLIPRFQDAEQGRVLIDGVNVREIDLHLLRRQCGVVYQESFLFSNTVAANICFGDPTASDERIRQAAKLASAHDFIERMPKGYDTVLGEAGVDLSGGQRQRISLARALLLEPSILILDDPTASVDAKTESEIVAALRIAMKGRTAFIGSNRLGLLRKADLVLVLDEGRLVGLGSHGELMRQDGPYRRAAELQFAQYSDDAIHGNGGTS